MKNSKNLRSSKLLSFFQKPRKLKDELNDEKTEEKIIKTRLMGLSTDASINSKGIIESLVELRKLIEQYGGSEKGRALITTRLESILPRENRINSDLLALKETIKNLSRFDHNHFEGLRNEYRFMSVANRELIEQELKSEWKKIAAEKLVVKLGDQVDKCNRKLDYALKMIVSSLRADQVNNTVTWIDAAIESEKETQTTFKRIRNLERKLIAYTKQEININKKKIREVISDNDRSTI